MEQSLNKVQQIHEKQAYRVTGDRVVGFKHTNSGGGMSTSQPPQDGSRALVLPVHHTHTTPWLPWLVPVPPNCKEAYVVMLADAVR